MRNILDTTLLPCIHCSACILELLQKIFPKLHFFFLPESYFQRSLSALPASELNISMGEKKLY